MSFSSISVGARDSLLSRKQVEEVLAELQIFHPDISFSPVWIMTTGDVDKTTSLKHLDKTDFFTKEIDQGQLQGRFRLSIHSAKDLPDPLVPGLAIVALTKGVDPSDALVCKQGHTFPEHPKIGASSFRRDAMVRKILPQAQIIDIRGTIQERLALLFQGEIDGLVVANAALIRLQISDIVTIPLEGEVSPMQGRLAVIAKEEDLEMKQLFSCIQR